MDRAFANSAFTDKFRDTKVWHVQTTKSDHCCLVIECNRHRRRRGKKRSLKYENMWRRDPSYSRLVEETWGEASEVQNLGQLQAVLARMQFTFQDWEQSVFGSVRKDLARLRRELEGERRRSLFAGPSLKERQLMTRISELLAQEEIMEKQRSRVAWLKEGDRNTKFFQAKAKERASVNKIFGLRSSDGELITEQEQLETMASNFYQELFSAQLESSPEGILAHVPRRVTEEMNEILKAPFTAKEVERALFMMGPNKAPGPDGFTAGFYQAHWDTIGVSVTNAVLDFLNGGQLPDGVNQTTIVLIPKAADILG